MALIHLAIVGYLIFITISTIRYTYTEKTENFIINWFFMLFVMTICLLSLSILLIGIIFLAFYLYQL